MENPHLEQVNQLFVWTIFNGYVTNYQRVCSHYFPIKSPAIQGRRPEKPLPPADCRTADLYCRTVPRTTNGEGLISGITFVQSDFWGMYWGFIGISCRFNGIWQALMGFDGIQCEINLIQWCTGWFIPQNKTDKTCQGWCR